MVSNILKLQPEKVFAGTDLQGNKYYEIFPQRFFMGLRQTDRHVRMVIPRGMSARPQAATIKVTNEWDAWLRKRRKDPPSLEELKYNLKNYEIMQEKVRTLEERRSAKQFVKPSAVSSDSVKETQTVDSWSADK